ncbi:MAG: hypothetical protein GXO99_08565 [Nitrospirae bacterium]|nr:hypothetical protein [Nitrospirota bacterium]
MFKRFFKKKSKKVVVLGIDGVPCSLLKELSDRDIMPNMAKLIKEGTLSNMNASIPEVSSTSWSTFMTAVNPARHGIYGFMEIDSFDYSWRFPNFHDLKSKTIWEIASDFDKKSIVINIPSTYPARPLNGMMVAGFVALDLKKATYPEKMFEYLNRIGYKLDVDASKAATAPDEFVADIDFTFNKRVEAIMYLFENEEWDLFIGTITETDRLHHYLWEAYLDNSHKYHTFFIDFYRKLDSFIGNLYSRIQPETPFIILSDHGFTEIKKEVYLNYYLKELGYLKFSTDNPESFKDISPEATAFALDPSRIYIHRKTKYSKGPVNDSEANELIEKLKKDFNALEIDGKKVIKEIYRKEDIYSGELLDKAPDLVLLPNDGFDLKGSIKKNTLADKGALTGGHTRHNATFYINRKIDPPAEVNIADVGSTILRLLDIPTEGLDGIALI